MPTSPIHPSNFISEEILVGYFDALVENISGLRITGNFSADLSNCILFTMQRIVEDHPAYQCFQPSYSDWRARLNLFYSQFH